MEKIRIHKIHSSLLEPGQVFYSFLGIKAI